MKINNVNSVSFTSVTPIIAKKGGLHELNKKLEEAKKPYYLQDATNYFKGVLPNGFISQAPNEGYEIGFLVTGKDYADMMFNIDDWHYSMAPSRHINRAVVTVGDKFESVAKKLIKRIDSWK